MILLLDVGNTSVTHGTYGGGRLYSYGTCLYNDIPNLINKCSKSGESSSCCDLVVSSVVPKMTQKIKKLARSNRGSACRAWIAGQNLKVPIRHRYKKPGQLGVDRAVNLYGALRIYKAPLLMLDFGTAITADYMSAKGVFEGGMIIPGPEISFQALLKRAALIPSTLRLPRKASSFLGRTTYDCIRSGVLEGFGALTDGIVSRFKSKYGNKLRVIATGGFIDHLKPYMHSKPVIDQLHPLKSLLLLFKASRS